jgi:hypothetical protein
MGEVGALADKVQQLNNTKDELLPPPYGAGYVFTRGINPLHADDQLIHRVVFSFLIPHGRGTWTLH